MASTKPTPPRPAAVSPGSLIVPPFAPRASLLLAPLRAGHACGRRCEPSRDVPVGEAEHPADAWHGESESTADLQDLVERLQAEGLDPSTIRNALMPVRTIYRRALE